jgi:hypothetical protein
MAPPPRRELPQLYLDLLRTLASGPFELKKLQLYRFREMLFDDLDAAVQEGFITYRNVSTTDPERIAFLGRLTGIHSIHSPINTLELLFKLLSVRVIRNC